MAKIISGIVISKEIRAELKEQISDWCAKGNRPPHLTAVLIGDDPASHTYVNNKIKVTHFSHTHTSFSDIIFVYFRYQFFLFCFVFITLKFFFFLFGLFFCFSDNDRLLLMWAFQVRQKDYHRQ